MGLLVVVIPLIIWTGISLPFVVAAYGLVKWRGGWRLAACVPLVALVLFFAPLVPGWFRDPTSHNLWGLIFLPVTLALMVYTGILLAIRRVASRREPPTPSP